MLWMHVVYLLLAYLRTYSHTYTLVSLKYCTLRLLANFLAVVISNYGRRRKTSIVIANAMVLVQLAITVQIEWTENDNKMQAMNDAQWFTTSKNIVELIAIIGCVYFYLWIIRMHRCWPVYQETTIAGIQMCSKFKTVLCYAFVIWIWRLSAA